MDKFIFIAIYMFASAWMRSHIDQKGYSIFQRLYRGLLFGAITGVALYVFGTQYRELNGLPAMIGSDLLIFVGLSLGMGLFSSLPEAKDEGESLRELLDHPDNITPKQRMEAIRKSKNSDQ